MFFFILRNPQKRHEAREGVVGTVIQMFNSLMMEDITDSNILAKPTIKHSVNQHVPAVRRSHSKPDLGAMGFVWLIRCLSQ